MLEFVLALGLLLSPATGDGDCDLIYQQTIYGVPYQVVVCFKAEAAPPSEPLVEDLQQCLLEVGVEGPFEPLDGYTYYDVGTILVSPSIGKGQVILGIHFSDKRIYVSHSYPVSYATPMEILRHEIVHAICPECDHGTFPFEICSYTKWAEILESGDLSGYLRGPGTFNGGVWDREDPQCTNDPEGPNLRRE
jgi:hypothetical protein